MANKRKCFLEILTTGEDPKDHSILSIGCLAENTKTKAKKNGPYSAFEASVRADNLAEVRDGLLVFLDENGVTASRFEVIGFAITKSMAFLASAWEEHLRFIGFPLDDPIDIMDLYSILENRKQVPVLPNYVASDAARQLGVLEEREQVPLIGANWARVAQQCYDKLVEMGARV